MRKAAIIVLSYNSLKETTQPCLKSIYECTTFVDFETVVVDNLSTDGTREYLLSIEGQYKNFKIILNDMNYGYAGGNNIGVKSTEAEYYILLNSDTVVTDFWLDKIVDFFENHPETGLVGPVTNSAGNEQRVFTDKVSEKDIINEGLSWTQVCKNDYFYTDMLGFFCVAVKKEVFDKIGLLDEAFGIGMFEDDDFCLRATNAGYKLACIEDVFIYHKGSVSFNKLGDQYSKVLFENLKKFEDKHGRKWHSKHCNRSFVDLIHKYLLNLNGDNCDKMRFKIENKLKILDQFNIEPLELQRLSSYDQESERLRFELNQIYNSKVWKIFIKCYEIKNKYRLLNLTYKAVVTLKNKGISLLLKKVLNKVKAKKKAIVPPNHKIFKIIKKEIENKRVIVFPTPIDWNIPLFQRPQQLAKSYAKKTDTVVIYFSDRHLYDKFDTAEKVLDNCWLVGSEYVNIVNLMLKEAKEVVVSISWTGNKKYLDKISYDKLIYEYIDELCVFAGYSQQMVNDHQELLKKADVTVATATKLYNDIKAQARNVILSPNAGDYEFFHSSKTTKINSLISDKIKNYNCVLGYYGSLATWFNYDMVKAVARQRPNWVWVLVGWDYDGTVKTSGILEIPNIIHIDAQPYEKLPSFLNGFNIATLPFKINEITLSTSPVKIFEYMAGGKPVLSPDIPECRKYESVFIYKDENDFITKAEKILALDKSSDYWDLLEREAKQNTWDARTDQILKALYSRQ